MVLSPEVIQIIHIWLKNLSVYFSVDGMVTSENIHQAFDDAGVDIDEIMGIQRRTSNRTWVASFASELAKSPLFKLLVPPCFWVTAKTDWC